MVEIHRDGGAEYSLDGESLDVTPPTFGSGNSRTIRFNIYDLAEVRLRTDSNTFYAKYGFNWPYKFGNPRNLVDERAQRRLIEADYPSNEELKSSVNEQLRLAEKMEDVLRFSEQSSGKVPDAVAIRYDEIQSAEYTAQVLARRMELAGRPLEPIWNSPSWLADREVQRQEISLSQDPFATMRFHAAALRSSAERFLSVIARPAPEAHVGKSDTSEIARAWRGLREAISGGDIRGAQGNQWDDAISQILVTMRGNRQFRSTEHEVWSEVVAFVCRDCDSGTRRLAAASATESMLWKLDITVLKAAHIVDAIVALSRNDNSPTSMAFMLDAAVQKDPNWGFELASAVVAGGAHPTVLSDTLYDVCNHAAGNSDEGHLRMARRISRALPSRVAESRIIEAARRHDRKDALRIAKYLINNDSSKGAQSFLDDVIRTQTSSADLYDLARKALETIKLDRDT